MSRRGALVAADAVTLVNASARKQIGALAEAVQTVTGQRVEDVGRFLVRRPPLRCRPASETHNRDSFSFGQGC